MHSYGSAVALHFRRVPHRGLDVLARLDLGHTVQFLEPLPAIVACVRRGAAHGVVGIEADGRLAGFFVVHPDRRDASCWWLGWLAVDRAWQGKGLGRAAVAAALAALRRVAGCRRVRLLVAADNGAALRLYRAAGFKAAGVWAGTGELVMEAGLVMPRAADAVVVPALTLVLAMLMRLWRRGVPPAARMSGEFHGPPGAGRAYAGA